jgi:hypothetical protein
MYVQYIFVIRICTLGPNGAEYDGDWMKGKAHGHGRFVHASGDVYEGDWVEDKVEGYGT